MLCAEYTSRRAFDAHCDTGCERKCASAAPRALLLAFGLIDGTVKL